MWVAVDDMITSGHFQRLAVRTKRLDFERVEPGTVLYQRELSAVPSIADRLPVPTVFISNFRDRALTQRLVDTVFAHPRVAAIFSVNVAATHPRLVAIPLGIKNRQSFLASARVSGAKRDTLLYGNFKTHTKERCAVWTHFCGCPWATMDAYNEPRGLQPYFDHLAQARFVLCPQGLGMDTYRTWEALASGSIPVVVRSPLDPLYDGLPVLVVDDWSDVTRDRLEAFIPETSGVARLTVGYWRDRITAAAQAAIGVVQ